MSNGNDRPENTWDDEYENDDPQTLRDSYLRAANQNWPRPRSGNASPDDLPETPGRSSNQARPRNAQSGSDIPTRSTDGPMRSRPARQSREEVYARLRQRPRRPIYARDQEEPQTPPPSQARKQERSAPYREEAEEYPYHQQPPARAPRPGRPASTDGPLDRRSMSGTPTRPGSSRSTRRSMDEEYDETGRARYKGQRGRDRAAAYEEFDEYDEYEVVQARKRRPAPPQRRRGRRVFSTLFTGCVGGLLTLLIVAGVITYLVLHNTPLGSSLNIGKTTYTHTDQQALPLGSATQLIVNDQAGNVSLSLGQGASVSSVKKVQASSQSDANSQFNGIVLSTKQVSQGDASGCTASSCLLLTATLPTIGSGGLSGTLNNDSIDLNITLPASFSLPANPSSPNTISVTDPAGNISVDQFNGILNLNGKVGTIHVTHTLIYAGTCIQTMHGNVNVDQGSFFDLDPHQASNLVPCIGTIDSSDQHPWYHFSSSVGDINITLPASSPDILLDASTNNGKINNDFNLDITVDGTSYCGSLLPNSNPNTNCFSLLSNANTKALLYLKTSTGNIALHRG